MPWVEETLRHDRFLDDMFDKVFRRFEDKTGNKWWQDFNADTPKVNLYRITFEKGLFVKGVDGYKTPTFPRKGNVCITRHMIMKRWDGELLSFAQSTGSVKVDTENLPVTNSELMTWFKNLYENSVDYTTVYTYTMDDYFGYTHQPVVGAPSLPVTTMTDDSGFGVLRTSLDVEYWNEDEYYPDTKQSPIVVMKLRGDTGEQVSAIGKLNYKSNTNWWNDSLIQLKGVVDENSVYFTLKADSAPMWEDNLVTTIPFFFGNLVVKNATKPNETPIAIVGGAQVGKFFNFNSIEDKSQLLQPVTRNYVHHPSNGVDSVMVKRTKYGARYQEHFLRWNAPPNLMPPTREELRITTGDIDEVVPMRVSRSSKLLGTTEEVLHLARQSPNTPEPYYYRGARHVIINGEEIATVVEINLDNETLTIKRTSEKVWSAGTEIKGYTAESLESIVRRYPRAWNYLRYGYYQYGFHPSRYSDKIHASRATVMHPEDGVIGHLPNIVLLPVINMMDGDKLKFPYWCETCTEPAYNPPAPNVVTSTSWNPSSPVVEEPTSITSTTVAFSYMCDSSVVASTINTTYWTPSPSLQNYMLTTGIGRELATTFWEGRNDWIDFFGDTTDSTGGYNSTQSKVVVGDFHAFLWKAIEDVKSGALVNDSTWATFNTWATTSLSCLTELQRASLFMATKLQKPVLLLPSSEGFLAGDILDKMIPSIQKVPREVYDFMDFNNVYVELEGSQGIVGAWVRDAGLSNADGSDAAPTFKSMVSFEPQLLQYPISAAKANRPFDYLKTQEGKVFGGPVVGGEYTAYYNPEMTDTNFTPYVASEIAVHEMAHALSNYGRDMLGKVLHTMPEWLAISWGVDANGDWDGINPTKSSAGTLLDNGKLAPISDYGCFSPAEDFAEAYMVYVINKPFLLDKFKAKYDFITAKLQAMGIDPSL